MTAGHLPTAHTQTPGEPRSGEESEKFALCVS
jgi:hypothetical protein